MLPTFSEYVVESLSDLAKGKGEPVRASYPKTNFKRFMDEWNAKLGKWVVSAEKKGYDVKHRINARASGEMVLDIINDDKLVSTAVVRGHDDIKSGDWTFDFYNQQNIHNDNKYRVIPAETSYEDGWRWEAMSGDNLHHSDQRNQFTQDNDSRTMSNSRMRDGEAPSWAAILASKKKRKSS